MFWGMESWDGWEAGIQERLADPTSEHSSPKHARESRWVVLEGVELNQVCGSAPCLGSLASVVAQGNG
jgi:hypothetical protein